MNDTYKKKHVLNTFFRSTPILLKKPSKRKNATKSVLKSTPNLDYVDKKEKRPKKLLQKNKKKRFCSKSCNLEKNIEKRKIPSNLKAQSLIERFFITPEEYLDLLSKPKRSKVKHVSKITQPTRRSFLSNWKTYRAILSPETLINSDSDGLKIQQVSDYFLTRASRSKKNKSCDLKNAIDQLSNLIVDFFKARPLKPLSFREIAFSDQLIKWLNNKRFVDVKCRWTGDPFKKSVVDVCDKIVLLIKEWKYFDDLKGVSSEDTQLIQEFSVDTLDIIDEESELQMLKNVESLVVNEEKEEFPILKIIYQKCDDGFWSNSSSDEEEEGREWKVTIGFDERYDSREVSSDDDEEEYYNYNF